MKITRWTDGKTILEGDYDTLTDLINANPGSNLSYSNLSYSNLSGSNLSYSDLSGSDLSYSDLSYSDLSYSDLSYSNLSYSDLSYSNLSGSNLSYSDLSYSNLSGSDLSYSNLSGSNLSGSKSGNLIIRTIYSLGPIGSRGDQLQIWVFESGDNQYKTGCFAGTEPEFIAAIEKNHGNNNHSDHYLAAIEFIKKIL